MAMLARDDRLITIPSFTPRERDLVEGLLLEVLDGIGDPSRGRLVHANIVMALFRALTGAEIAALSPTLVAGPPARTPSGYPVAVLWETAAGELSTRPCERPRRQHLVDLGALQLAEVPFPSRPNLWTPIECGACPPCRARNEARAAARSGVPA